MSNLITVYAREDLPCNDWQEGPCGMELVDGEVKICFKCGWSIGCNVEEDEYEETIFNLAQELFENKQQ